MSESNNPLQQFMLNDRQGALWPDEGNVAVGDTHESLDLQNRIELKGDVGVRWFHVVSSVKALYEQYTGKKVPGEEWGKMLDPDGVRIYKGKPTVWKRCALGLIAMPLEDGQWRWARVEARVSAN